jgi:hypothetical protein
LFGVFFGRIVKTELLTLKLLMAPVTPTRPKIFQKKALLNEPIILDYSSH